jgi:hypothetical protein
VTGDLRRGQNHLDPASEPRHGFGGVAPFRLQHLKHRLGVDLVDRQVADRLGVFAQRHHPLLVMLRILPAAFVGRDIAISHLAEGRRATGRESGGKSLGSALDLLLRPRIDLVDHVGARLGVQAARLVEADLGIGAEAEFRILAREAVAIGPEAVAGVLDAQEQAVAIGVASGVGGEPR